MPSLAGFSRIARRSGRRRPAGSRRRSRRAGCGPRCRARVARAVERRAVGDRQPLAVDAAQLARRAGGCARSSDSSPLRGHAATTSAPTTSTPSTIHGQPRAASRYAGPLRVRHHLVERRRRSPGRTRRRRRRRRARSRTSRAGRGCRSRARPSRPGRTRPAIDVLVLHVVARPRSRLSSRDDAEQHDVGVVRVLRVPASASAACSSWHGMHHEFQKFTSTVLPAGSPT